MPLLENIADSRIKQFGADRGLNCFVPKVKELGEPTFKLCVVHADKLEPVYYDGFGMEDHPHGSKEELGARSVEEEAQGHNTYLFEIAGRANGYFNKDYLKDKFQALEILFHEGFHRRRRRKEYKIHNWFEESAAKVVGLEATFAFFKEFGNEDDEQVMDRMIQRSVRYATQFNQQLEQRLAELAVGNHCPIIHLYNNARIYDEYPYYGHFNLCHSVFKRMGTFRGFVELISGLPQDLNDCRKILGAIEKY